MEEGREERVGRVEEVCSDNTTPVWLCGIVMTFSPSWEYLVHLCISYAVLPCRQRMYIYSPR